MDRFEKRYLQDKSKVVVGRKTAQELVDSLMKIMDIDLVELTVLPKNLLEHLQFNIQYNYDEEQKLKAGSLEYKLYVVVPNWKSEEYYKNYADFLDGKIFILFEMKTGSFELLNAI